MSDLLSLDAHLCHTATAILIYQKKVLLVNHKKLNIWLAPGGHCESGELPHQTAERECFEETGITVKAINPTVIIKSKVSQYIPVPIVSNIHWVSKSNYLDRINSQNPKKLHTSKLWPKGCEQHLVSVFLVKPMGDMNLKHDPEESNGIGWFQEKDIPNIDTSDDIKQELIFAFQLSNKSEP